MAKYTPPRPPTPPQPKYRLVCADDREGFGLLAVRPMLPPRRGPKPAVMVLQIVGFNGDVFVVKSHEWVYAKHFNGIFATVEFEDGAYRLEPEDGDTGTYDAEQDALIPKAGIVAETSSEEEEEPELVVQAPDDAPEPLPKKAKRKSHHIASAKIAVGSSAHRA